MYNILIIIAGFILFWTAILPFLYKKGVPWILLNFTPFRRNLKQTHKLQMKSITDLSDSTLARMLHDPNVSVENMEKFKAKAKVTIEIVQMAQKAEDEQLVKLANGLATGRIIP